MTGPSSSPLRDLVVGVAIILVAGIVAMLGALEAPFFLDDTYRIVENGGIRGSVPFWRHFVDPGTSSSLDRIAQYRPLLPLTLAWNYAAGGLSPFGYHLGNLTLHLSTALLVLVLGRRLFPGDSGLGSATFWAALLFAVHPVASLVVGYASARDLALATPFMLAAVLASLTGHDEGATPWKRGLYGLLATALTGLGMLAKTNAATVPALILMAIWATSRSFRVSLRAALGPALAVAAFFAWTAWGLGFSDWKNVVDDSVTPGQSLLTQLAVHATAYLPHALWPFGLTILPEVASPTSVLDLRVLLGAVLVILSCLWALLRWRQNPEITFLILAYWLVIAPEASLVPFHHARADYRPYAALPFLLLAGSFELSRLLGERRQVAFVVLTGSLAFGAIWTSRMFRSEIAVWRHAVDHGGDATACMNLAMSLRGVDDGGARAHFERALEKAPRHVLGHINYGLFLIDHGEVPAGIAEMQLAIKYAPNWAQPWHWWSIAARRLNLSDKALEAALKAVEIEGDLDRYRYQAGRELVMAGRYREALAQFDTLRTLTAPFADALYLEGYSLQMLGDLPGAELAYKAQLAVNPNHPETLYNLGYARMKAGRCAEAVPLFERTLVLTPDSAGAKDGLARCRSGPR